MAQENYTYYGAGFSLDISQDFIGVKKDGRRIASLSVMTMAKTVTEKDGEFTETADGGEHITSFEKIDYQNYRWTAEGGLWKKEYTLTCDVGGFNYKAKLIGRGNVGRVEYFSGGENDEGGAHSSSYQFCEYFVPCPGCSPERYLNRPAGVEYRSFFELLIPPPYCFSFRTEELSGRFGLGLFAKDGEYNFIHYDYNLRGFGKKSTFHVSTDLEGHTKVDGEFELPMIRGFFGCDDIDVVRKYCEYNYSSGLCQRRDYSGAPRWWYGPIVCGWNEQEVQEDEDWSQQGRANQKVYTKIAGMIQDHGIRPTILIIDDKWQKTYGECLPDPERWPDMRAFTDEMHTRGIHTLLWFRLWGGEGLPEDEVMDGDGVPYNMERVRLDYRPYADPTNEKYRAHLKKIIYTLLSSDEGCMNCDGFKLDYSLVMPYGKCAKSAGGKYGTQMTKELYKLIYETAKEVKPDALINASPCHPYFAEVCDQARLHDYAWTCRNETETMRLRAKLFDAAMPGISIDTDSVNLADHDDAMRFYRHAPELGIPDIYQFSNDWVINFSDEDWREIEKIFNDYSDKMDELHGRD